MYVWRTQVRLMVGKDNVTEVGAEAVAQHVGGDEDCNTDAEN